VIGRLIEHRTFGRGTIQEARHRGLDLYVLFEDGVRRWVRIEDVRFLSVSPILERAQTPVSIQTSESFRSRSMVEAFRLGIVPYGSVEAFTFGRNAEISQMKEWLNNKDTGTLIVEGEYGSGKSHLLEYLYALALNQGYAVAMTELDPNESPPFKPKAVYRKLIQSFRYRDGSILRNFRDFLRALIRHGKERFNTHRYLSEVIEKAGTIQDSEWLWNWIEGKESYYWPVLYEHGTAANIYCNILGGLSWGTCAALGLKGLVVILDEAENVDRGYWYQVDKGLNLFYGLAMLASNDVRLANEGIVRKYEPGIGTWFGKETNLIYHGHARTVRYCFKLPSFLKVAFAFTPTYYETYSVNNVEGEWKVVPQVVPQLSIAEKLEQQGVHVVRLDLQPLSEAALKEVFEHVCLLYDSSYSFLESDYDIDECFEHIKSRSGVKTRSFIKGAVEVLDLRRFHPNMSLGQIE